MFCGVHAQSPVYRVGQSGVGLEVLDVVTVLVVACITSALVSAAVGYYLAPGGPGGLRAAVRRLNQHDDDLAALEERISRREKKAASEKGVAARSAQEEIAHMLREGVHLQARPADAAPRQLSRAEIGRRASWKNGAAAAADESEQ